MKDAYDILVIGGGPAGAIAAKTAAEAGFSVLLVEKRPAIGCRCGALRELLCLILPGLSTLIQSGRRR